MAFDEDWDVGESSEAVGFDLGAGMRLDLDLNKMLGASYLDSLIRDIDRMAWAVMVSWRSPKSGSWEIMGSISACARTELVQESSCCMRSNM